MMHKLIEIKKQSELVESSLLRSKVLVVDGADIGESDSFGMSQGSNRVFDCMKRDVLYL